MKKGISIWSFRESSLRKCFQMAKAAGFDGVELALEEQGELSLNTTPEEIAAIAVAAKEEGVALYSVACGLGWVYPLTVNDPVGRAKAEEIIKKQIDASAILGCDTTLVVPGVVTEEVPYDIAYDRALDALKRLAPYAAEKGVVIGVENVWNKFLLSPLEMKQFVDAVGSPYVKAYFDVGNVVVNGYPEQWIRILGDRIAKIHFKDFKGTVGNIYGFTDLLSGDVNYPEVMQALKEIGYDNWVTGELTPYPLHPLEFLSIASKAMDVIFANK